MNDGRSHASRAQILAAFASIYLVWGSTYLAIRYAVETIPPFLMGGLRFVVSGALLYVWARYRGAPSPTRLHWRNAIIAGGFLWFAGKTIGGKGIHLSINFNQYCYAVVFTVGVCVLASMLSVWKVLSLEPAEVFKG